MWAVVLAAVLGPADKCWLDEDVIPSLAASLARPGSLRCVGERGCSRGEGPRRAGCPALQLRADLGQNGGSAPAVCC